MKLYLKFYNITNFNKLRTVLWELSFTIGMGVEKSGGKVCFFLSNPSTQPVYDTGSTGGTHECWELFSLGWPTPLVRVRGQFEEKQFAMTVAANMRVENRFTNWIAFDSNTGYYRTAFSFPCPNHLWADCTTGPLSVRTGGTLNPTVQALSGSVDCTVS